MISFDRGQRVGQGTGKKEKGKRRGAACFSFGRRAKAHPELVRSFGTQTSAGIKYDGPWIYPGLTIQVTGIG